MTNIDLKNIDYRRVYITSDTHYGHTNIVRGISNWSDRSGTRNFETLEYHNDCIVSNINRLVAQGDYLIHLGDWSFGGKENIQKFRERIICKNIILIPGNHDHHLYEKSDFHDLFLEVFPYMLAVKFNIGGFKFVATHQPYESWPEMSKGYTHLHGHMHRNNQTKFGFGKKLDVGVDGNNLMPYTLYEIKQYMEKRTNDGLENDHHSK